MDLKRPSRLLGPANEPASLVIRRCLVGEVKRVRIDPPKAKRSRYAAMTRAGRLVGHEATVRPSKRFDRRTGVLQALTKQLRRYRKGLGALRAGEIKNVAEDVRQTVWPIETLEHAESTADLHFLDQLSSAINHSALMPQSTR